MGCTYCASAASCTRFEVAWWAAFQPFRERSERWGPERVPGTFRMGGKERSCHLRCRVTAIGTAFGGRSVECSLVVGGPCSPQSEGKDCGRCWRGKLCKSAKKTTTGPRTKYVKAQNFGSAPKLRQFLRPAHGSYWARSVRRKIEPGPFKTEPEVRRTPCTCTTSRTRAKTHAERPRQNSRGDSRQANPRHEGSGPSLLYSRRPEVAAVLVAGQPPLLMS